MADHRRSWSIASRIFAVQLAAVVVLSGVMTLVLWLEARQTAERDAAALSLAVAQTIAKNPAVIGSVQAADPTAELQPYARQVIASAHVDFVTIMSPAGIRFTHPNPAEIGKRFKGTISGAARGHTTTETYTGTLGPSVRAVVPVESGGRVVGLVSAGVTLAQIGASLASRIPFAIGAALLLVLIGSVVAFLARRDVSQFAGRMRPSELAPMVQYYESVLHSVREGLILVDNAQRVVLYNDEAAELLDLPPATSGGRPVPIAELALPESLVTLLGSGRRAVEESHVAGRRVLLVNQEPALPPGHATTRSGLGTVATLRDRTELAATLGELASVRTLKDGLRSQTHEFANRMHTVVCLLELGRTQEAIDFIAAEVTVDQSMADAVMDAVGEPALAALLLGKTAEAAGRGVELTLTTGERVETGDVSAPDLISVLGNLIDNAIDAAAAGARPGAVAVHIGQSADGRMVEVRVRDSGDGVGATERARLFDAGYSTKDMDATGRGFGLAVVREVVVRRGGSVAVGGDERGAEFIVLLPLATPAVTSLGAAGP